MVNAVLASNNKKKISEIITLISTVGADLNILSLSDIGYTDEIIENGDSFEENSLIKAKAPASRGYIGIADDSGLAVDYLNGAPGIYSARYSGENANDEKNRAKLLSTMAGVPIENRKAGFVCCVSIVLTNDCGIVIPEEWRISKELSGKVGIPSELAMVVRGECRGHIMTEEHGRSGFGYDPLFFSDELGRSFAEVDGEEKNRVSHRGHAMSEFTRRLSILFN